MLTMTPTSAQSVTQCSAVQVLLQTELCQRICLSPDAAGCPNLLSNACTGVRAGCF